MKQHVQCYTYFTNAGFLIFFPENPLKKETLNTTTKQEIEYCKKLQDYRGLYMTSTLMHFIYNITINS